jgi:hypothetical protein
VRRIYVGLATWNLLIWLGASVAALLPGDPLGARAHALLGLFAAFFACLVPSILIAHFIGSMKWMQQTGRGAGIPDAQTKALRTAWVKDRTFPALVAQALLAVATGVSGAFADGGGAGLWLHACLAALGVPAILAGLVFSVRGLDRNRARMASVAGHAAQRRERGEVREEPREVLLPEAGRAGGKVFLYLSLQAALLWVYVRFVLRRSDEPLWPYALAAGLCLGIGTAMLRAVRPPRSTP